MARYFLVGLLVAFAFFPAGGALAENSATVADAGLAADRTKSNALTPELRDQAQKLFEQSFALLQSGDFQAAQLGFEQGLMIDPGNSTANFYLAETLLRQSENERARSFYNKVIALDPNSAEALKAEVALRTLSASRPSVTDRDTARAAVRPKQEVCALAAAHWSNTETIGTLIAYEDHLARFPICDFAALATARIAQLNAQGRSEEPKASKVAVVAPPVAPAMPSSPCGEAGTVTVSLSRTAAPLSAPEECVLKPKDVFKECDKCPEMVVIPAGRFVMGSPESEPGREGGSLKGAESPQHSVTILKPFAVGKFHVTVDQFAAFVAETGYDAGSNCAGVEYVSGKWLWIFKQGLSWRNPGFTQDGSHPAVCLNWFDATAYVGWLAKKTGKNYRLLTETEWEYAARAGTTTRYFFGDDDKDFCRYGNGGDQTAKKSKIAGFEKGTFLPCSDGYAYTSPVGSFPPNGFGLYDMHGNAFQFVEDCFHINYQRAPTDGSAWLSGTCDVRVVRNGSWRTNPGSFRAAFRSAAVVGLRGNDFGFRLARTLTP